MKTHYVVIYEDRTGNGYRQTGIFGVYETYQEAKDNLPKCLNNNCVQWAEIKCVSNGCLNSSFSFC